MTFKIIDKKTGTEPTGRVIHNIAKKGGLIEMDINQFFVGEDGSIVLADDCGNMAYVDMERFIAVRDSEKEQLPKWVTNGDVIVTLFPNMKVEKFATFVKLSDGEHYIPFGYEWWNEPYKRDDKEGYTDRDRCMYCKEMFDLYCAKAKKSMSFEEFSRPPYKPEWCPGRTPSNEYHD